MALKVLTFPQNHAVAPGKMVKMGRKRPDKPFAGHRLQSFFVAQPPAPPATTDYWKAGNNALREMYGNDTLGDCVIAYAMHTEGTVTGNASSPLGVPFVFSESQVIETYGWCGYVDGDPSTDNGCVVESVLEEWKSKGLPRGSKLAGFLAVDPTNEFEMKTAVWLFENLCFGLELPDAWVNPMPNGDGFTWDVAGDPDPENGHCIAGVDLVPGGIRIDTWAMQGTLTYAAIAKYCAAAVHGEVYTVLTPDIVSRATQKAPNGFAWAKLRQYFQGL